MKPEPLPQRPSLVSSTLDVLRQGLGENRWAEGLPGERQLSAQLGVSRPTLRKALAELREDGLVTGGQGQRLQPTGLASPDPEARAASGKVIVLSPEPLIRLPARAMFVLDELRATLSETGRNLHIHPFAPARGQIQTALKTLLRSEPLAVFILYQQERETHRFFLENKIPCVIFGSPDPKYPLPAVDTDQRVTARHAAQHLLRKGHSAGGIALVFPSRGLPGHMRMSEGFREALGTDAMIFEVPMEPEKIPTALDRILATLERPAAFMFARSRHAACALTHFAAVRRLAVPGDVSVLCLNDDPILDYLRPRIARYQTDNKAVASTLATLVLRVASGASAGKKNVLLFPDFLPAPD